MKIVGVGFTNKDGEIILMGETEPDCAVLLIKKELELTIPETATRAIKALEELK